MNDLNSTQPSANAENTAPPTPPTPPTPSAAPTSTAGGDDNTNKVMAIIGYIVPILFFVPLISDAKNDAYAKYHSNQQLVLLLYWVLGQIVLSAIPIIGWILMPVLFLFGIILVIIGVVNAANMKMKPLPLIGKITIIK